MFSADWYLILHGYTPRYVYKVPSKYYSTMYGFRYPISAADKIPFKLNISSLVGELEEFLEFFPSLLSLLPMVLCTGGA